MNQKSTTGLDYANGKITRLFSKMFFPTLLGLIFNALLTIIDGIFVGQGVGPEGIAAVNIIAPLFMVATGTGLMFGIGSSVIAGIAISRNDSSRASINTTQAYVFCAVFISLLAIVLLFSEKKSPCCSAAPTNCCPVRLTISHGLFRAYFSSSLSA